MAIRFDCSNPECFKKLSTEDEHVGRQIHCPACGAAVQVPSPEELGLPEQIGPYRVIRELGEGGTGIVFEVAGEQDARFALKWLSVKASRNQSYVQRFRREAKAAATMNHPNIVHVHETGEHEKRPYILMDFIGGKTAKQIIDEEGKLSVQKTLEVGTSVAAALQYAYKQSFIHRDIKPENILLTPEGRTKLTDLGLAKNIEDDIRVTESGTGIGTPYYMAPEQSTDAAHSDYRADIYSLGITMLHMMTGRLPYEGRNAMEVIRGHVQRPLPTGQELGHSLPEGVELLLHKMCVKKPDYRFQSYAELLEAMARVREGKLPVAAQPRQSRSGLAVTIMLILFILSAIGIMFIVKSDEGLFGGIRRWFESVF
jgi:serine/threonine-protein kinase